MIVNGGKEISPRLILSVSDKTGKQIIKADHLPIKDFIDAKVTHQPVIGKEGKWRRNGM